MKKVLLAAITLAITLVAISCGKENDNPVEPPQQEEEVVIKKIKEVNISFLGREADVYFIPPRFPFFSDEVPHKYTLKTAKISYEYDKEGRISKIIEKEEGKEAIVKTVSYLNDRIKIEFLGKVEGIRLDEKGKISDYRYTVNEKGQLVDNRGKEMTWENENLTAATVEKTDILGGGTWKYAFTYNDKLNKNNFFVWGKDDDVEGAYMKYFSFPVAYPFTPTKNLLETITIKLGNRVSTKINYVYTYDKHGYVAGITEKQYGEFGISFGGSFDAGDYDWSVIENLVAKIKNGSEKKYSYQLVSEKDGVHEFEIIQPINIAKDVKGKTINLLVDKIYSYKVNYTEKNGVKTYGDLKASVSFREKKDTTYEIIYQ